MDQHVGLERVAARREPVQLVVEDHEQQHFNRPASPPAHHGQALDDLVRRHPPELGNRGHHPAAGVLRQIANPLLLGDMGADATHFVLGQYWKNHFDRKAAETGAVITVTQLRHWIDLPKPMGLPKDAQNLVILTFAEQTNRTFYLHNAPVEASLAGVQDQMELREWVGPVEAQWNLAVKRSSSIFGLAPSPLLNAANAASLSSQVKQKGATALPACRTLCQRLRHRLNQLELPIADSPRMQTATAVLTLVERICSVDEEDTIPSLAAASVATSEAAMGTCLTKAAELGARIEATDWEIFEAIGKLTDERRVAASGIREEVGMAVQSDEHVVQLASALKNAQSKAVRLLTDVPKPKPELAADRGATPRPEQLQGDRPIGLNAPSPTAKTPIDEGTRENLTFTQAEELLAGLQRKAGKGHAITLSIRWRIDERGGQR